MNCDRRIWQRLSTANSVSLEVKKWNTNKKSFANSAP
ncbi:unnamed protein product [Cylicostephanus goldi]|uniref:Uncharacterized protein n=1 Tax=Cylicostephanus goldi TaxID=71465 RepID=A0A3P6RKK2_CYLGO|nr:unnamed protein product [Cylicostephanus goldi]